MRFEKTLRLRCIVTIDSSFLQCRHCGQLEISFSFRKFVRLQFSHSMNSGCWNKCSLHATNSLIRSLVRLLRALMNSGCYIAYSSQFTQLLTVTSMLLLSSSFEKLKWHRIIYFSLRCYWHQYIYLIRITEIELNLRVNMHFGTSCSGETQDDSTSENYRSEQRRTCPDGPWRILEMLPPITYFWTACKQRWVLATLLKTDRRKTW